MLPPHYLVNGQPETQNFNTNSIQNMPQVSNASFYTNQSTTSEHFSTTNFQSPINNYQTSLTTVAQDLNPQTLPMTNNYAQMSSNVNNLSSIDFKKSIFNNQLPPINNHNQLIQSMPYNLINNFEKLGFNNNQMTRYLDLMQFKNLLDNSMTDNKIQLPMSVCNPDVHCSPDIFRCTMSAIPESSDLLNKCRLPLGLVLHPFRDLKNLTVIQTQIVRCRYCRTYINPYVYLPDNRHWKCNLCYRLNDLPEEFSWDPITKSFGDPTRRPEIQTATIEYIAPNEYMLRTPQPALYLFIFDVGSSAIDCGYLHTFSEQLSSHISLLPGDERTMVGFMAIDMAIHFFQFTDIGVLPKHLIVHDVEDPFLPVNNGLFVELKVFKDTVTLFVQKLPEIFGTANITDGCCLGSALNIARDLIQDVGGRISVFLTSAVNFGMGALPTQKISIKKEDKLNLKPLSDYYKALALECTSKQIAVDLFVIGKNFVNIATLADIAKYSSGSIYYFPNYHLIRNEIEVTRFSKTLTRYLTRKIGFEAVLRIRCSRGLLLHTFYGNFFVRSTDLLAMANVNPDSALGVQIQIEENLNNQSNVCFQAALLYTSSKGDRRIRVHTLCLPVINDYGTIFNYFDVKATVSLLSKMAIERAISNVDVMDCREALINAVTDALSAYNRSVGQRSTAILVPIDGHLKFFPLYTLGLLKNRALTAMSNLSINLDERIATMLFLKNASLERILLEICPALYQVHNLDQCKKNPERLSLSYEQINCNGIYLMDTGTYVYLFVCMSVSSKIIEQIFDVKSFQEIDEDERLPTLSNSLSQSLHNFLRHLFQNRGVFAPLVIIREDSLRRDLFINRLINDRTESSHSYIEFLQHLRHEMSST